MKVLFACMGTENIGVEYLCSYLKSKGHECSVLFDPVLFDDKHFLFIPGLKKYFSADELLIKKAENFNPDILCFSVMTCNVQWTVNLAEKLKSKLKVPVIFGGIHASMVPEILIKEDVVDYIVVGEGEESLLELVSAIQKGEDTDTILNVWSKHNEDIISNPVRPLINDINSLPFPDKSEFIENTDAKYKYRIKISRGCPYNCSFCSHNYLKRLYGEKGYVRIRSPQNVIEEIEYASKYHDIKYIKFMDDIFTLNKKWLKEFLELYSKKFSYPYECITHPSHINEEITELLKSTGCSCVEMGIQSFNADIRKKILNRNESDEEISRSLKVLEKSGIPYDIDYIFGLPDSSENDHYEAAEICSGLINCSRITCYILSYFPKLEIIKHGIEKGIITENEISMINRGDEAIYYYEGIIKNYKTLEADRIYMKFFKLLPILPVFLRKYIIYNRKVYLFKFIPDFIMMFLFFITLIYKRENVQWYYLKHYLKHIKKILLFKIIKKN